MVFIIFHNSGWNIASIYSLKKFIMRGSFLQWLSGSGLFWNYIWWNFHQILFSKVRTEKPNLGNPSKTWWHSEVTLLSHVMQKWIFQSFSAGCMIVSGKLNRRVHHLNANNWQFECQSALTFSKIVFQVYIIIILSCSRCDVAMS